MNTRFPHDRARGLAALLLLACATSFATGLPTKKVHVFYYPWYQNPSVDGGWLHWNHPILPQEGPITFFYSPPDEIGASFYPESGPYSSNNPDLLETHTQQILSTGAKVVNLSWWGPGHYTDESADRFIEAAETHGLLVNFTIEPYAGRTAASVKSNIEYLLDRHADSPALYRYPGRDDPPMFYVYDSYLIDEDDWAEILAPGGAQSIRGTAYDAAVIALYVDLDDEDLIRHGHFDGFYTYFAVKGFTRGSTISSWDRLRRFADQFDKIMILNVGPGYDDTRVRPWNTENFRLRDDGQYFDTFFEAAIDADPDIIGITSFNEWHEGTQIEPAVPKAIPGHTYRDYRPHDPGYYLNRTRLWTEEFVRNAESGILQFDCYE